MLYSRSLLVIYFIYASVYGLFQWLSGKKKKKNLPAVQETQIQSLGWEDPLEEGMATQSSILV